MKSSSCVVRNIQEGNKNRSQGLWRKIGLGRMFHMKRIIPDTTPSGTYFRRAFFSCDSGWQFDRLRRRH
jgi:hypothetical protein